MSSPTNPSTSPEPSLSGELRSLEFQQQQLDQFLRDDLEQLVRLALREDLDRGIDLTTSATVPLDLDARADIVARVDGVVAGTELIEWIVAAAGATIAVEVHVPDGGAFVARQCIATLSGNARELLTSERTILNFLGRLCGIATQTRQYVLAVAGTSARVYDTRKTTPGWRRLEKYAVRCGGGCNHRGGLYDAVLIKDNHLASHFALTGHLLNPADAVASARRFLAAHSPHAAAQTIVEIEVDSLEQLSDALGAEMLPDIVLLDNMPLDQLRQAVGMRDAATMTDRVQLEASGGVNLTTIRGIAETGVDRISVGALTHSAVNLDLGLDWSFTTG